MNIWDFWANKYDKLWVQKYSLKPTREYILSQFNKEYQGQKVLDLGCGPGELIRELLDENPNLDILGVDFSKNMLDISKKNNPKVRYILMDVSDLNKIDEKFHSIISTHSFPYYKNHEKVIKDLYNILEDDGKAYIGFASGNSIYDKIALLFVKLTTGPANYPSDKEFKELIFPYFKVENIKVIKERKYMPRIAIYTLEKVLV